MQKKTFIFGIALASLPIGIITYQLAFQKPDQENTAQENFSEKNLPVETHLDANSASVTKETTPAAAERVITIKNNISKAMITYHKIISITPNFTLTVNDQTIKQNEQITVPVIDGKVNVAYAYDFKGHRKGKKSVTFEVPQDKDTFDITFSWKNEPRISMENAQALEVKEIY
jgi:hypothetical protein